MIFLNQLWLSTEKLASEEQEQSRLLSHQNFAFSQWAQSTGNLIARAFSDEKSYNVASDTFQKRLEDEFSEIRKLPASKGEKSELAQKLENMCMLSVRELNAIPSGDNSGVMSSFKNLQLMPPILKHIYSTPVQIRNLLEKEYNELIALQKAQNLRQKILRSATYFCIGGNIALSIFLVWKFSINITRRLAKVTLNSTLLPKLERLPKNITGKDELAYLDAVLQESAENLCAAAEHRQAIFRMVAHDIRSPLMAAQMCLDLFDELAPAVEGKEELNSHFQVAQVKLGSVLEQVKTLLVVDSAQASQADLSDENSSSTSIAPSTQTTLKSIEQRRISSSIFSLKIFHKVLAIVLIPLFVQTVFLLLINSQVVSSENLVKKERLQTNLVMSINMVFLDSLRATISEALFQITREPALKEIAIRNYKRPMSEIPDSSTLEKIGPEWKDVLIEWTEMMQKHIAELSSEETKSNNIDMNKIVAKFKKGRPLQHKTVIIGRRATALFQEESIKLQNSEKSQKEARKKVGEILWWGIFINFLLGIGMLLSFSKDISQRLSMLLANAAKLGSKESLQYSISGADELASLDLVFHHIQESLRLSAQDRMQTMQLIAEEMNQPLIEARKELQVFQENEKQNINQAMGKQLNRAQYNIDRVLDLINDLITMETLETGKIGLEISTCNSFNLTEESIATVSSLAAQKNIELINNAENLELQADKARLIQVLVNLISNAIKFSDKNTQICITAKRA
ncbi:MAG: HAMP domain-containing histidine kinase, partial [Candidatus Obscuribacterales bacterium]|nr:HAMP domain-containing histidine kinase [Candidatus Obscuribacterales bacterium]